MRAILAQPKRLALLAYLAVARPPGPHRRDTLLAIFWPDLDEEHARGALSRAVYYIRRSLSGAALASNGADELSVSLTDVQCDATDFEAALVAGNLEEALALYRGDLLEGFFISDAPEFDRWLEGERTRLRGRAEQAAETLADRDERNGNLPLALQWARRAADLAPYDEAAFRRLARVLDRAGDRAAAIRACEAFRRRLKEDLEVELATETEALVEEIRGRARPSGQIAGAATSAHPPLPALAEAAPPRLGTQWHLTSRRRIAATAAVVAIAAIAVAGVAIRLTRPASVLDRNVVAVLPFRVTGDPSLAYLREGMVDLLAAKLSGDGGPRAVDPQAVISVWRHAVPSGDAVAQDGALVLARRLRAVRLVTGSVVGTPGRVVLEGFLFDVPKGRQSAVAAVQGTPDSLLTLIDGLAAQLLARGAGEDEQRLASLTSTSLPALRLYLAGQAAYRRGAFREASRDFQRALFLDSSFVLAAFGLGAAASWTDENELGARAYDVVWTYRSRLTPRDQTIFASYLPLQSSLTEQLAAAEHATAVAPDRPEAWYRLADLRFHAGSLLGSDRRLAHQRAAAEFGKALEFDSGYAPALSHLLEYAVETQDGAAARRFGSLYLAVDSAGDLADYVRWLMAIAADDKAELAMLRSRLSLFGTVSLLHIVGNGQLQGNDLDDIERAAAALQGRPGSREDLWQRYSALHNLALNRGRPGAALGLNRWQEEFEPVPGEADRRLVLDALWGGGDSTAAAAAVDRLWARANAPLARTSKTRLPQYRDLCVTELWRVAHGHSGTAQHAVVRLRTSRSPEDVARTVASNKVCAIALDAALETALQSRERTRALGALDSVLLVGPVSSDIGYCFGNGSWGLLNLLSVRLHEEQGDLRGALSAARRRSYDWSTPVYLASFLREEGRLAALMGDREGAARAYQHYLALRAQPEASVTPEVVRIRAELGALSGQPAR